MSPDHLSHSHSKQSQLQPWQREGVRKPDCIHFRGKFRQSHTPRAFFWSPSVPPFWEWSTSSRSHPPSILPQPGVPRGLAPTPCLCFQSSPTPFRHSRICIQIPALTWILALLVHSTHYSEIKIFQSLNLIKYPLSSKLCTRLHWIALWPT